MSEKSSSTVTTVKVEKHSGSDAHATISKNGKQTSGEGKTANEALSNASNKVTG